MAVTDDRKFTKDQVFEILTGAIGKTLGEVDKSRQFDRTIGKPKVTGIAGDVIEQSVFGYKKDSKQECDIEIDGVLTELKTTGVRIPKSELKKFRVRQGIHIIPTWLQRKVSVLQASHWHQLFRQIS